MEVIDHCRRRNARVDRNVAGDADDGGRPSGDPQLAAHRILAGKQRACQPLVDQDLTRHGTVLGPERPAADNRDSQRLEEPPSTTR